MLFLPELALEIALEGTGDDWLYDMVDEAQDLLREAYVEDSALRDWKPPLTDVSDTSAGASLNALRFATVSSFKGLEADVVLLVDVDDLSSNDGLASVMWVPSRAKLALYVFIANKERDQFQNLAKEFGRVLGEG